MDCNYIKKRISAIIDNELDKIEIMQIKEHLKICKKCRILIEEYREIERKLLLFEEIEPEKKIEIIEQQTYPLLSLFNLNKLIPVSLFLTLFFILFISFIFITPVIYGNTETQKQTIVSIAKSYIQCIMKPSLGHSAFIEFCRCSSEILGKCCCNKENKNCKGGHLNEEF